MSILQLDTPPWQIIVEHLGIQTIRNIANTHPVLRRHIRKLAQTILRQRMSRVYCDTEPLKRLMQSYRDTHYTAHLRYIPPKEDILECMSLRYVKVLERHHNIPAEDVETEDDSCSWHANFTIPGLPLPTGASMYLLVYAPTGRRPTRIWPFLNVDDAIHFYISSSYYQNVRIILETYMDDPNADPTRPIPTMDDPDLQSWIRACGHPIVPYTPDNIRAYMRTHLRAWVLELDEADYVQIIPYTI